MFNPYWLHRRLYVSNGHEPSSADHPCTTYVRRTHGDPTKYHAAYTQAECTTRYGVGVPGNIAPDEARQRLQPTLLALQSKKLRGARKGMATRHCRGFHRPMLLA